MAKRTSIFSRAAVFTNGILARVYVRDWKNEPVGKVKKALRQEVALWAAQASRQEEDVNEEKIVPDIDAIQHLNQFGTPEAPIMEITSVPDKLAIVRGFMEQNNIEMSAPDLNPFLDPTADLTDKSPDELSRSRAHFTRVLLSWWKAANDVQRKETALFYQRLI